MAILNSGAKSGGLGSIRPQAASSRARLSKADIAWRRSTTSPSWFSMLNTDYATSPFRMGFAPSTPVCLRRQRKNPSSGLLVQIRQSVEPVQKGLAMDMSYTLSRQRGDTFDNFGDSYDVALNGIQDLSNLKEAAHTLSPYDQRHIVKGYAAYQLPFGNGHRLLANRGGILDLIVSGWTLCGLVTYASGQPLSFYSPNIYNYYPGWAAIYVNYDLGGYKGSGFSPGDFTPITSANPAPRGNLYFPASVVSNPPDGQLGTGPSRVNVLRGFGIKSEDASVLKYFRFGSEGRFALSVRVEFYNLFNRNTFANPSTTVGSPQFGYVTGSTDMPRQGQFGARFQW